MTISLYPSWKSALLRISSTLIWYPLVKNNSAFAYRDGVVSRPSRSGSSPTHSISVLTAAHIFASRASACSGPSSMRPRAPLPGRPERGLVSLATDSPSGSWAGLQFKRFYRALERSSGWDVGLWSRCLFLRLRLLVEEMVEVEDLVAPATSKISFLGSDEFVRSMMR
jgi:hypothetical protein